MSGVIIGSLRYNHHLENLVKAARVTNNKLQAVKEFKELSGFGLKDAKDWIDSLYNLIEMNNIDRSSSELQFFIEGRVQGVLELQQQNRNISDLARIGKIAGDIASFVNQNEDLCLDGLMNLIHAIARNKLDK